MTPLTSIFSVLLVFTLTIGGSATPNGQSNPGREFKFTVKSGYQNNGEVIRITYANLKPKYRLKVSLVSKRDDVLSKEYSGITNGIISLDTNAGVKELTAYAITLKIIDGDNKVLFTSNPSRVITGKTKKNISRAGSRPLRKPGKLNNAFLSRNKAIEDLFFDDSYSLIEYRSSNDTVYTIAYFSKTNHFLSINLHSNEKKILNTFPGIKGLPMLGSSLDDINGKFFFIGHTRKKKFIFVLDVSTGKILKKHELKNSVILFEYNRSSDKLIGITQGTPGGTFRLGITEIDVLSGKTSIIGEVPGLSGITIIPTKIDFKKDRFLFWGDINGSQTLIGADISSGEISIIETIPIGVNSYRIHSFDSNQSVNTICTSGVQACTGVVGYNKEYKVGFILHILPFAENNISSMFHEIDSGLKKLVGSGLSKMEIRVVGGKKGDSDSFYTVISVYRELLEKYRVKYERSKVYHLGKQYNIFLDTGNIDIF